MCVCCFPFGLRQSKVVSELWNCVKLISLEQKHKKENKKKSSLLAWSFIVSNNTVGLYSCWFFGEICDSFFLYNFLEYFSNNLRWKLKCFFLSTIYETQLHPAGHSHWIFSCLLHLAIFFVTQYCPACTSIIEENFVIYHRPVYKWSSSRRKIFIVSIKK